MRILQLTNNLHVGGISKYIVSLSEGLRAHGVDVMCASSGGELVYELQKSGVRHIYLNINTKNELHPKLIVTLYHLVELIKMYRITHIHAHTRIAQLLASLVQKMTDVAVITTCHGFFKPHLLRRLLPAWGNKVIAISEAVREHLVNDFKVPKDMIACIPNGINVGQYREQLTSFDKNELRKYFGVGNANFVIGSISKVVEQKGFQYLIKALPAILQAYPKTQVLIVGDGKYRRELLKLARKLDVARQVVFVGNVENVRFIFEIIDLFVLPTISAEGFGLAILEAMAYGKAVVATNIGSAYTLVKDGENGLLVAPEDARAISEAVLQLIGNPDLIEQMGRKGVQLARSEYSLEKVLGEIIAVYREVRPPAPTAEIDSVIAEVERQKQQEEQRE